MKLGMHNMPPARISTVIPTLQSFKFETKTLTLLEWLYRSSWNFVVYISVTRCRSYTTEPSTKPRHRIGREHFRRNRSVIVGVHYTVRQRLLKRVFERRVSPRITLTERTSRQWDMVSPRRILGREHTEKPDTERIPDYRTLQKTRAYSTGKCPGCRTVV
jgi:hypothetical protein